MINFNNIKMVILDCDGVLTDGKYFMSNDQLMFKSFYTRDFYAIEELLKNDIDVSIITQSTDSVLASQINRICSSSGFWKDKVVSRNLRIIEGSYDKKRSIELFILSDTINNIGWENICYVGDAENDLECMKLSYFSACPIDAIQEISDNANYESSFSGGDGAVYDIINFIIERRKIENENS